jgi:hypothetical protein
MIMVYFNTYFSGSTDAERIVIHSERNFREFKNGFTGGDIVGLTAINIVKGKSIM